MFRNTLHLVSISLLLCGTSIAIAQPAINPQVAPSAAKSKVADAHEAFTPFIPSNGEGPSRVSAAANQAFKTAEKSRERFLEIKLVMPVPILKKRLVRKAERLQASIDLYKKVSEHGDWEATLAADYRIGELYGLLWASLNRLKPPADLAPDLVTSYQEIIDEQARPLHEKSQEVFGRVVRLGKEHDIDHDWVRQARLKLKTQPPEAKGKNRLQSAGANAVSKTAQLVLVRSDARLFEQVPTSDETDSGARTSHEKGESPYGFIAHLRELGPKYAKINIAQSTPESQAYCGEFHRQSQVFDLEVYVRRDDLLTVVQTLSRQEFSDRSSVTLWPGLVVQAKSKAHSKSPYYEIRSEQLFFSLPVKKDNVGIVWSPGSLNPVASPKTYRPRWTAQKVKTLRVDGKRRVRLVESEEPVSMDIVERSGRRILMEFNEPCIQVRAWAANASVEKVFYALMAGNDGLLGLSDSGIELEAGKVLKWTDGRRAGKLIKTHHVAEWDIVSKSQGSLCFKAVRHGPEEQHLVVCTSHDS